MGFLFLALSLPTLLECKAPELHEEWQQIRQGLRLLPGKSHIPKGLLSLSSQRAKAAEYRGGYPNSHLALELYLNIANIFLTQRLWHHHFVPARVCE